MSALRIIGTPSEIIVRKAGAPRDVAFYEKHIMAVEPDVVGYPWTVVDAECETICECRSEAAAVAIAEALNAYQTTEEAAP